MDFFTDVYGNSLFSDGSDIDIALAKLDANDKGAFDWAKLLDNVLKYGGKTLTILTSAGIIKDKNKLALGEINQAALQQFLLANAGRNLSTADPETLVVPRQADPKNPFGLDTTTILLIGGALLVGYYISKK